MSPYLYAIQQAPTDGKRDSLDRAGEALASIDNEQSTATWADACFRRRWGSLDETAALRRRRPCNEASLLHGIDNRTPPTPLSASAAALAASHKPNALRTKAREFRALKPAPQRRQASTGRSRKSRLSPTPRRVRRCAESFSFLCRAARHPGGRSPSPRTSSVASGRSTGRLSADARACAVACRATMCPAWVRRPRGRLPGLCSGRRAVLASRATEQRGTHDNRALPLQGR